jgi:hypothetical protein
MIYHPQNWKRLRILCSLKWAFYLSKRDGSNEYKTALGKEKLQQVSSAVKYKLHKTMHVTVDPGCSGESQNLRLIPLGEEYEVKVKLSLCLIN